MGQRERGRTASSHGGDGFIESDPAAACVRR